MMESTREQEVRDKFQQSYVVVSEIANTLNVTKAAVHKAVSRGDLPPPVFIGCRFALWERTEVEPYIEKWLSKSNRSIR